MKTDGPEMRMRRNAITLIPSLTRMRLKLIPRATIFALMGRARESKRTGAMMKAIVSDRLGNTRTKTGKRYAARADSVISMYSTENIAYCRVPKWMNARLSAMIMMMPYQLNANAVIGSRA